MRFSADISILSYPLSSESTRFDVRLTIAIVFRVISRIHRDPEFSLHIRYMNALHHYNKNNKYFQLEKSSLNPCTRISNLGENYD